MSRWTVTFKGAWFYPPGEDEKRYGLRWCVTSPIGVVWSNYATWREAMNYADKQARTIAVTLPRTPHLERFRLDVRRHPYGEVIELRRGRSKAIQTSFPKDSWEPLALALLSYARGGVKTLANTTSPQNEPKTGSRSHTERRKPKR